MKRHDYLPFGEELTTQNGRTTQQGYSGDSVRQKFSQKERDTENGLDFFLARYYAPTQARFVSPDEFKGGPEELFEEVDPHDPIFYADLADPQSLNKYHYCINNPLRYLDPDGHQQKTSDKIMDFFNGVGKGITSSITFGASGAPRKDDSLLNRAGQGVGTVLTHVGGRGAFAGGGGATLLTAGTSSEVTIPVAAAGVEMVIGSTVNAIRLATTPMQRNSESSSSDEQKEENKEHGRTGGRNQPKDRTPEGAVSQAEGLLHKVDKTPKTETGYVPRTDKTLQQVDIQNRKTYVGRSIMDILKDDQ